MTHEFNFNDLSNQLHKGILRDHFNSTLTFLDKNWLSRNYTFKFQIFT